MIGDWFVRTKVVHLPEQNGGAVKCSFIGQLASSSLRIKVRMSRKHLKELMNQADKSKGTSELGRLILQDCLEGKLRASVVGLAVSDHAWRLNAIKEE